MRLFRRSVLFLAAGAGLVAAQLGCSGSTKPVSVCQDDTNCPDGQMCRISDGLCVLKPKYTTLTIIKTGDGSGTITSTPAAIDCGSTCEGMIQVGAKTTLTAAPALGSQVASFAIGCLSASNTCEITPTDTEPVRVLVNFSLAGTPPPAAQCNASGFCWENPKPTGNRMNDSIMVGPREMWAVGNGGTIVHSVGTTNTLVASGTTKNLNGIWGSSGDLYVVGDGGTILHGVGGSFSPESAAGVTTALNDVWGSGSTVIAVGAGGVILRRSGTWSKDTNTSTAELRGVYGSSLTDIWAVGVGGTTVRFDGSSWTPKTETAFAGLTVRAIAGNTGTIYAIDSQGGIYLYNAGWTKVRTNATDDLWGLTLIGTTPYVAGSNNGGMVMHYDGSSWVKDVTANDGFRSIAANNTGDQFAVGDSGVIWQTTGTPWQPRSTGTTAPLYGVWAVDAQNVWAVGGGGTVMRYNGSYFSSVSAGASGILYGVWAASAGDVWAVGIGGNILHYDGTSWKTTVIASGQTLRAIYGVSASRIWAVGDNGTVVAYDGTSWTPMAVSPTPNLRAVWATSATDIWAAGDMGNVLHSTGGAFSSVTPGPATTASIGGIFGSNSGDFWVTADTSLFRYQAGSWSQSTPSPAVSGLRGLWGTSGTDLYATGSAGTLLRFNSISWTPVDTGAASDLTAVVSSQNKLWVVGTSGTILRK